MDNGLSITSKGGRSGRLERFPAVLADYAEQKSNNNEKMAPESEAAYCQERWHEKLCRALPKPDVRH